MNIVQIVTQMEAGGAQKVAYLLHEGLKPRIGRSELWFLYTKRPAYADRDGVVSLFNRPPSRWEYALIVARLYRRLVQAKPDVVITHTRYSNLLGQVAARAAGVPTRMAVHHNPMTYGPQAARVADRILGQLGTYSKIVAVSQTVADTLQDYPRKYRNLLTTIHNGLAFPTFDPTFDVRRQWNIPDSNPVLLSVGRLSKEKNHATLFRALCDIPDAHLAVVGDGELRPQLTALAATLGISNRVHFTGELTPEAVASYLNSCNVFVFPSLWEGLPLAAIEALHAGAPIVASDIPATREVLDDAAVMVPAGEAPALAAAILRILENPSLARELSGRARQRATRFTAAAMIDGYHRLICGEAPAVPNLY